MSPRPSPVIVLVEPQMGENIGMVARAMANMGLTTLRLVAPRDGWPNDKATATASGADQILAAARLVDDLASAIADCHMVYATTAVDYAQAKRVIGPRDAAETARRRIRAGQTVAFLFGRERIGLLSDEIARASAVVTIPVDPAFTSLNIAQAVLICGYEWLLSEASEGELLPFVADLGSPEATDAERDGLFAHLQRELDAAGFFTPAHKREVMSRNLRNILIRRDLTQQDVRTLHGVITQLVKGPKPPDSR